MGGDCWAESVEGKGSTFYLLITTQKAQKAALPLWSQTVHAPQQAALITMHPSRFLSLTRNLETWKIRTDVIEGLAGLVEKAPHGPNHDLIIVDIVAEGLSDEAVLRFRQAYPKAKVSRRDFTATTVHMPLADRIFQLVLLVGPMEAESYKKRMEQESWTVLSKPVTAMALYCATCPQLSSPQVQVVSQPSSPSTERPSKPAKRILPNGAGAKKSGMDNRYALVSPT
jgi:hypothetical protein